MRLKDFIERFKPKRKSVSSISIVQPTPVSEEKNIDIKITQENNHFKIVVADYYKIEDYVNKMKEIDKYGVDEILSPTVLWNGRKQAVNKGTYYVFAHNNKLYSILLNDEMIDINERTPIGKEILNKSFTFYLNCKPYSYFRCMHDENRSSYNTRYYSPKGVPFLELSKQEFLADFNSILSNLASIQDIENIIDLKNIKSSVEKSTFEDTLSK